MRVQSFLTFRACLGPLNAIKFGEEEEEEE